MTVTSCDNPQAQGKLIIRAVHPDSSVWVYLAKDVWNRKHDGSVYYWSNNMMISTVLFDTEEEAVKKLNRLGLKQRIEAFEVVPFQPDVQIVYLDGRVI